MRFVERYLDAEVELEGNVHLLPEVDGSRDALLEASVPQQMPEQLQSSRRGGRCFTMQLRA